MTKPTPKIDPEIIEAAEAAQTPQKLAKPFVKQVEDMKAEAAPAAEILGRNVEDPFDLDNLRVNQNFGDTVGVKKLLTTVPVRKPGKQEFVRVHPDPTYREILPLIDLKEDREVYVVTKRMISALAGEIIPYTLFTSITRQGVVFLWPVRLPSSDGRVIEWHRSAAEAAGRAMTKWIVAEPGRFLSMRQRRWPGGTRSILFHCECRPGSFQIADMVHSTALRSL